MDSKRFGIRAGLVAGAAAALISGAAWHGLAATSAAAPSRCSFATTISGANAYVVEAVGHTRASMAEWRTG